MEKNNKIKKILVLSFEAGSAEIISNYLVNKKKKNFIFILNDVAKKIFKKNKCLFKLANKKIDNYNITKILFGAGYNHDEINIIKRNNLEKCKTICFLDHWVFYKHRFTINKKVFSPSKIILFDKYAYRLIKKIKFNKTEFEIIKNPFLLKIKKKIKKKNKMDKKIIIFLNNLSFKNPSKKFGFYINNKKLIDLTLKYIKKNYNEKIDKIYVKLHPSNNYSEYKKKLKKYGDIRIIKENDISKVISEAKLVVSNDGMPIYLSHVLGIENLNIVSNKPSQVPNNFCNKILYVK